mgnify:CR=1 FL=1
MRTFVSLSDQPLVNITKVHYITKEDSHMRTPDGVAHYVCKIKFTFAQNRILVWTYKGDGAVAGAMAQDDRDRDYATLKEMLL